MLCASLDFHLQCVHDKLAYAQLRKSEYADQNGRRTGKLSRARGGFLAAALARVMSVAGPIPALASVSVLQSAPVDGSVVGVVGPL